MDAVEVARHFEQALADVALTIAPDNERVGSAVASYAEPGSRLNQCWNFGMHGAVTPEDVDRIITFFDSHQCDAKVGIATLADPSATKALAGRGFELGEFINILVADLTTDQPPRQPLHPAPVGLEIKRVDRTNDESIEDWAELSTRGFNEGNPAPTAEVWTAAQALRYDGVDGYVATMDGEPAAAAAVALNDSHGHRSAGLFATSVLPAFRCVGIQQHLIATRLRRASELGATFATIGSLPGIPTERNAARFGFRLTYVQAVFSRPYSPEQSRARPIDETLGACDESTSSCSGRPRARRTRRFGSNKRHDCGHLRATGQSSMALRPAIATDGQSSPR